MPRFSLILPTCERTVELGCAMSSLLGQHCRDFELLVMDQNADERVVPFVASARAGGLAVRHIRLGRPGLSGARNRGIAEARGDYVAFPDDDCWYEPDTLAAAAAMLDAEPALDGLVLLWAEQAAARGTPADDGLLREREWRRFREGDASSIGLVLRRELLAALGGFDERLGLGQWFGAGEETDLVFRALARQARIRRCPRARVHHRFGAPASAGLRADAQALLRRARGTGALYAKHRLGAWTVLRGLVAPLLMGGGATGGWRGRVLGGATSLGRLQGMIKWWVAC